MMRRVVSTNVAIKPLLNCQERLSFFASQVTGTIE